MSATKALQHNYIEITYLKIPISLINLGTGNWFDFDSSSLGIVIFSISEKEPKVLDTFAWVNVKFEIK